MLADSGKSSSNNTNVIHNFQATSIFAQTNATNKGKKQKTVAPLKKDQGSLDYFILRKERKTR
jgi:hypothetical protein